VARGKAFVILDGTLLRIDRAGMASGRDREFYPGKHKAHGVNVQVIADPAGRLVWISPTLPGHGTTWAQLVSTASSTLSTRPGSRPSPLPPTRAGVRRSGSHSGGVVSIPTPVAISPPEEGQPRPRPSARAGERVNAQLKNWWILRKIRSCPSRAPSSLPQFRPS
jgi:hypothetical protein